MPNPARVLIIHPALAPYRIDLFNALSKQYRVRFLFLNKNVLYQSYDQETLTKSLTADYGYLEKNITLFKRQIHFGISDEIRSFLPDIIVTHEFSATTFFITLRKMLGSKIPHLVWTADNPRVIQSEHPLRTIMRKIILPRIDGLIVYGEETRLHYNNKYRFNKPIDTCANAQSEESVRVKLEKELPLAEEICDQHHLKGKKVLLFVGRLTQVKRLDLLISAFESFHLNHPDVVLALVGEGSDRKYLEQRVLEMGLQEKTLFVGHVEGSELYAWFNCGTLFVLTSEFEPWGAVVNEALVAGLPVICSDKAGAKELIEPGVNGEVVNASEPKALSLAIQGWLKRCPPILPDHFSQLRPMQMQGGFQDAVQGFCSALKRVS
jgi:glycosyltransferase involved in cell wall biosynthesis